jgi:alanine dehydrogenase
MTLLFDLDSSELLATIESNRLGQLRTGSATALAVRHLLREGPVRLGLLGAGTVARGQLEALHAELGSRLQDVRCWSRRSGRGLAEWADSALGRKVTVTQDVPNCVRDANLVVTATSAMTPILDGDSLGPEGVLCAVGANWAQKREVDGTAVHRCRWWVDDLQQARLEAGDLLLVPDFDWDQLGSLSSLVQEPVPQQGWRAFKSLGLGLEDLAAASMVYDALHDAE